MPREKPLYRDTLVTVRARAAELYPGEMLFGPGKVAKILGRSRGWVWLNLNGTTQKPPKNTANPRRGTSSAALQS